MDYALGQVSHLPSPAVHLASGSLNLIRS
jgi:hypothetical protein